MDCKQTTFTYLILCFVSIFSSAFHYTKSISIYFSAIFDEWNLKQKQLLNFLASSITATHSKHDNRNTIFNVMPKI